MFIMLLCIDYLVIFLYIHCIFSLTIL